jgi:hypothetical protein
LVLSGFLSTRFFVFYFPVVKHPIPEPEEKGSPFSVVLFSNMKIFSIGKRFQLGKSVRYCSSSTSSSPFRQDHAGSAYNLARKAFRQDQSVSAGFNLLISRRPWRAFHISGEKLIYEKGLCYHVAKKLSSGSSSRPGKGQSARAAAGTGSGMGARKVGPPIRR